MTNKDLFVQNQNIKNEKKLIKIFCYIYIYVKLKIYHFKLKIK